MSLIYWPEIELFHNIKRNIDKGVEHAELFSFAKSNPILYRGKIKLHGTNSAVQLPIVDGGEVLAQSRTQLITPAKDNQGFAAFVHANSAYFLNLVPQLKGELHPTQTLTIFGEWAGRGICHGASVCTLRDRIWAIFGLEIDGKLITNPDALVHFCLEGKNPPPNVHVLPWHTGPFQLQFGVEEALEATLNEINALIEHIDNEDPWIKATFGVAGPGEGLVWYPVSMESAQGDYTTETFQHLAFKTKGSKHSVVQSKDKKAAHIAPEQVAGADEFVQMFVTEQRCDQGVRDACGGAYEQAQVGKFIQWLTADVQKESKSELEANNLEWKQVSKAVTEQARKWFLAEVQKRKAQ